MSRFSVRSLALVAVGTATLATAGACSRSNAAPAARADVPSAMAATTAGAPGAGAAGAGTAGGARTSDSTSNSADLGRIRGAEGAQVWLVEISDFQCPFCKRWHDDAYRIIDKEYVQTGKVRVAYINYPIPSLHANARAASEAAMCGSVQGKFWEMHDALFDTQAKWSSLKDPLPLFDSLAVAASANQAGWRRCMATHATLPLIEADTKRASAAGISSTPSFFIGNRILVGAYPIDSFRVVLNSAIANARPR